MHRSYWILSALVIVLVASGCSATLPFNYRADYATIQTAKSFSATDAGPIAIKWIPPTFPERIDTQGPSGLVGSGSNTSIPTGVALANRITELLDVIIGVKDSADKVLTISVINAKSEFEYSAAFIRAAPSIDVGRCLFEAEFTIMDKHWTEMFTAQKRDPKVGASSQTGILEKAWDDIALQVAKSVLQHMKPAS